MITAKKVFCLKIENFNIAELRQYIDGFKDSGGKVTLATQKATIPYNDVEYTAQFKISNHQHNDKNCVRLFVEILPRPMAANCFAECSDVSNYAFKNLHSTGMYCCFPQNKS